MDWLHQFWLKLGQPSYVSEANGVVFLIYLVSKLFDFFGKTKRDQEFKAELNLLDYRISKVESSLGSKPKE